MKELNKEELLMIEGGIKLSGTLINSLVKGFDTILDVGRSLGSAIRRSMNNNICPIS